MVLEKTLENPLDCKEIQPVHSKGDQPWDFFGRNEKVGSKLNIQKTKVMASGPITSWQIDGETGETVEDFILRGSKITTDGNYSHKIKRCMLFERKVMTNLDSIFKSRDITLPTKVHSQSYGFSSSHIWM